MSATYTHYELKYCPEVVYPTLVKAMAGANKMRRRAGDILKVTRTFEVGDPVLVQAFGRERDGYVIKLNRATVEVSYTRNKMGDRAVRKFRAGVVRHPNTVLGRVVIRPYVRGLM